MVKKGYISMMMYAMY